MRLLYRLPPIRMHISSTIQWYGRALVVVAAAFVCGFALLVYGKLTPPHVTHLGIKEGIVEIRFNRIPEKALAEATFSITPSVPGQLRWQGDMMRFFPQNPLPDGAPIRLKIGTLTDGEGAPRAEFSREITTPAPALVAREGERVLLLETPQAVKMIGNATALSVSKDAVLLQKDAQIELYRASCDCSEVIQRSDENWQVRAALLSTDSRYVVLHQTQPATREGVGQVRLWLYDTKTRERKAFWEQNTIPDGLWLTPEGSGLIVREAGRMTFFPFEAGKGEITFLGTYDRLLDITPQGDALLFLDHTENLQKLVIVQHQKDPQEITMPGIVIEEAEISPDLSTLYMLVRDANTENLPSVRRYVVSHLLFNDVKEVVTTDPLWSATDIALSRDGRQLVVGFVRPSESATLSELRVLDLASAGGLIQKTLHTGLAAWSDLHWIYPTTQ